MVRAISNRVAGHSFIDSFGVQHVAPPLTGADVCDLVEKYGDPSSWRNKLSSFAGMFDFLWHSLRKEDLTQEQIGIEQWRWTKRQVGEMFLPNADGIALISSVLIGIFSASGMSIPAAHPATSDPAETVNANALTVAADMSPR